MFQYIDGLTIVPVGELSWDAVIKNGPHEDRVTPAAFAAGVAEHPVVGLTTVGHAYAVVDGVKSGEIRYNHPAAIAAKRLRDDAGPGLGTMARQARLENSPSLVSASDRVAERFRD